MLTVVIKIKDKEDIKQLMAAGAEDIGTYFIPQCLKLNSEPESVLLKDIEDSERYSLNCVEDIWKKGDDDGNV